MSARSSTPKERNPFALRMIEAHVPADLGGDAQEALREFSGKSRRLASVTVPITRKGGRS